MDETKRDAAEWAYQRMHLEQPIPPLARTWILRWGIYADGDVEKLLVHYAQLSEGLPCAEPKHRVGLVTRGLFMLAKADHAWGEKKEAKRLLLAQERVKPKKKPQLTPRPA